MDSRATGYSEKLQTPRTVQRWLGAVALLPKKVPFCGQDQISALENFTAMEKTKHHGCGMKEINPKPLSRVEG